MKIKILDNHKIDYTIRRSKRNKITIKINPIGKVNILVPRIVSASDVNQVVEKNIDWIKKTREKVIPLERKFITGEDFLFLGKKYQIEVIISKYEKVYIMNDKLFLYTSSDDLNYKKMIIENWLKDMVEMTFSEIFNKCFQEMEPYLKSYPKLLVKRYRSRWGCCYPTRNTIILNDKLIHLPLYLIRYVIMHEMSHLLFPSHNQDFHRFLQSFIPNELECRRDLRKYSVYYE